MKHRWTDCGLLLLLLVATPTLAEDTERGITTRFIFNGNRSSLGQIYGIDGAVGYRWRHFEMRTGLPVFFIRPSDDSQADGYTAEDGIGNAYLDLALRWSGSANFSTTLRGTVPTGDSGKGFSTGRVTFDWTNYVDGTIGKLTPFASAGLANTVSDTYFFEPPFSSLGLVTHFEGGTGFELGRGTSLGASLYAVVPFGEQKVYSKLVKKQANAATNGNTGGNSKGQGQGNGKGSGKVRGQNGRVFETESTASGEGLTRDGGASVWFDFSPSRIVIFQLGFSRSVRYAFNTVFFSITLARTR